MKMHIPLDSYELETMSVVHLINKDTGKRRKLATLKPADRNSFNKERYYNKDLVEVQIFIDDDISTFYFSNGIMISDVFNIEVSNSPLDFNQLYNEHLLFFKNSTIEEFITSVANLVRIWEAAPEWLSLPKAK